MSVGQSQLGDFGSDRPTELVQLHTEEDILRAIPSDVLRTDVLTPFLMCSIRENLGDAPLDRFTERIKRRWKANDTLGKLFHLSADVGTSYRIQVQRDLAAKKQQACAEADSVRYHEEQAQEILYREAKLLAAADAFSSMSIEEQNIILQEIAEHPDYKERLSRLSDSQRRAEMHHLALLHLDRRNR
jgi:hypothetical protein